MEQPWWAHNRKEFNAHHLFPVELQNDPVFDVLTSVLPGWDHHNPLLNGVALPTTLLGALRSGLPVHQVTPKILKQMRELRRLKQPIPPGVVRDLQGHPKWNEDVAREMEKLHKYLDDPVRLREEVLILREKLLSKLHGSGRIMTF